MYTDGPKQTVQDLIAVIGGASGSLIGMLGFAIFVAELFTWLTTKCKSQGGAAAAEAQPKCTNLVSATGSPSVALNDADASGGGGDRA